MVLVDMCGVSGHVWLVDMCSVSGHVWCIIVQHTTPYDSCL